MPVAIPLAAAAVAGGTSLAVSATAATAIGVATAAGSAAMAIQTANTQRRASNMQADAVQQAAAYNAQVDIAQARQVAMDANANIQRERLDNNAYLSKQTASYAASGVLSDTGSPLAVQATTAGRMEQDIQQYWASTQQKEALLYAEAKQGVYEAGQQAEIYHLQGAVAVMNGIGRVIGSIGQGVGSYQKYG